MTNLKFVINVIKASSNATTTSDIFATIYLRIVTRWSPTKTLDKKTKTHPKSKEKQGKTRKSKKTRKVGSEETLAIQVSVIGCDRWRTKDKVLGNDRRQRHWLQDCCVAIVLLASSKAALILVGIVWVHAQVRNEKKIAQRDRSRGSAKRIWVESFVLVRRILGKLPTNFSENFYGKFSREFFGLVSPGVPGPSQQKNHPKNCRLSVQFHLLEPICFFTPTFCLRGRPKEKVFNGHPPDIPKSYEVGVLRTQKHRKTSSDL